MKLINSNKQISFAMLLLLIFFISICSVQAGDVNETALNSGDDIALSIEENVQLESDDASEIDDDASTEDTRNETLLTSPTTKMHYNGNYQVTLIDSNTKEPLADKAVNVTIADKGYSLNTDSNGIAKINLKLAAGTYRAVANFAGDDNFKASNNLSAKLKVFTTIKAKDIAKFYNGSKKFQATYLDSNGKALKNKKVTITVKGKKYTAKTNTNGVASLAVNLKPGTYKVATANPVTGEKKTTSFKILSTISASDFKKVKGDSNKFIAKFYKSTGKALTKTSVRVKINGTNYNFKTNSYGKLKLSFKNFKKGTYNVICYNPDGLSKTVTVKILSIASTKITVSPTTFLENEKKVLNVKLTTALGDGSNSAKKIMIFVDGYIYSKKTNSNGEIALKLPSLDPGLHDVICAYDGNKFFKSSRSYNYLAVLNTSKAQFSAGETQPYGSFSGTPFTVVLSAGDVPLIQRKVTFNINGKTVSAKTDNSGLVSVPISLEAGNYTISYKYSGDSKVSKATGSHDISVFDRTNTTLSCSYKSSYDDSLQTFEVYLADSDGNPLEDKSVELTIANQTSEIKTDAYGYAALNSVAPVGKYDFTIRFKGDNDYNSSFTSGSTKVTLSQYGDGINEKKGSADNSYLRATSNCQVNDAKIKSLVKSLTKGLTTDLDKAKALFDYVQLNIEYDYYFNTEKGALNTLSSKKANGADQAHLLIAMYRTAGFKARYVHGNCDFYLNETSFGHVWTQVLVDNTWICGDTTALENRFGNIESWNVDTCTILNKYRELPF